jgi:hypothetical protein
MRAVKKIGRGAGSVDGAPEGFATFEVNRYGAGPVFIDNAGDPALRVGAGPVFTDNKGDLK